MLFAINKASHFETIQKKNSKKKSSSFSPFPFISNPMDSAVGFLIEGGVILLSDQSAGHSVLSVTRDEDRILTIWPGARDGTANTITAMACQGDDADRENVAKYLIRNVILHNMRTGMLLLSLEFHHFTSSFPLLILMELSTP